MTALTIAIVLTLVVGPLLVVCVARERARRAHVRDALLAFFAEAAGGHDLLQAAVDADWVALRLAGLAPDAPIGVLAPSAQARVLVLREEVIAAAEDLIRRGLVARMPVVFQAAGRGQLVRPPRGLFVLTPRGAAVVLTRSASHAAAA
jgi:hypothetical protein